MAEVTAATTTASATAESDKKETPSKQRDYNPRWKGYSYILLASFINFAAISTMDQHAASNGNWAISLSFGVVQCLFALVVLVLDRLQLGVESFSFHKAHEGHVEGYCLLGITIYAIVGVAFITQASGIAYLVLNVYASAWLTVAACIYTLNKWTSSKDLVSIGELTSVSATLKSWYIVFIASMVVAGSSMNMLIRLGDGEGTDSLQTDKVQAAAFGIVFGLTSTVLSAGFILVHYNLIEFCVEGGWFELFCIVVVVLMWIVGTAVLTQDGGIGATIEGSGCRQVSTLAEEPPMLQLIRNELAGHGASLGSFATVCELVVQNITIRFNCTESDFLELRRPSPQQESTIVPGSNLYLSVWTCLLASLNLASRWKAQQALQFAQAQQKKVFAQLEKGKPEDGDDIDEAEEIEEYEEDDDNY